MHLNSTASIPVFQVKINNASKTPNKKRRLTATFTSGLMKTSQNIKHKSSTQDDEPSGHKDQEHPTPTENDIHQMTTHDNTGHRKTSLGDQKTLLTIRTQQFIASPSKTVIIQVFQENKGDLQKVSAILLEQLALPTPVNFESQFFQKLP